MDIQEYGQLVVLGYSSYRVALHTRKNENRRPSKLWEPVGQQNSTFVMKQRPTPNGVEFLGSMNINSSRDANVVMPVAQNSLLLIPTFGNLTCSMEFGVNQDLDMFQIGRMPVAENDFVVPGPLYGVSGTVSRYAARIICSRTPPYSCTIYAGGFDNRRCIRLPSSTPKWCGECHQWLKTVTSHHCVNTSTSRRASAHMTWDSLTKNGVRVWLPEYKQWYEVSVNGNLFPIEPKESRDNSIDNPKVRKAAFNRPSGGPSGILPILTNNCVIDLGGIQLQYKAPGCLNETSAMSLTSHLQ
jgi:pellino protein